MKRRRLKLKGRDAVYHVFSRSISGEKVFHEKVRLVFSNRCTSCSRGFVEALGEHFRESLGRK